MLGLSAIANALQSQHLGRQGDMDSSRAARDHRNLKESGFDSDQPGGFGWWGQQRNGGCTLDSV
jgi:hypothetical protein